MFSLVEAIATAIENRVIALKDVESPVSPGDSILVLSDFRGYNPGDLFIIYEDEQAEIHQVAGIDETGITICGSFSSSFTTDAKVQKTQGGNRITNVYRGDPPAKPLFPAISVSLSSREREPLTLEDTEDTYIALIRTYVDVTKDHENQYRFLLNLTHTIENSLYIPLYLRIPPFFETALAENVEAEDTIIKTVDPLPRAGNTIIEDAHKTRTRTILEHLGDNTYELNLGLPAFDAGSKVIQLLVHSYDPAVLATDYGDARDESLSLRYSEITYSVKILRQRNKTVII